MLPDLWVLSAMLPELLHSLTSIFLLLELERRHAVEEGLPHRQPPRDSTTVVVPPRAAGSAARQQVAQGKLLLAIFIAGQFKTDLSRLSDLSELSTMLSTAATLFLPLLVAPLLAPTAWERHRCIIRAATRLGYFSLPIIRNPRVMSHVLQTVTDFGKSLACHGCSRLNRAL